MCTILHNMLGPFLLYFIGMTYIEYTTCHKRRQNDIFHGSSNFSTVCFSPLAPAFPCKYLKHFLVDILPLEDGIDMFPPKRLPQPTQ